MNLSQDARAGLAENRSRRTVFILRSRWRLSVLLLLWLRTVISKCKDGMKQANTGLGRQLVCAGIY